MTLIYTLGNSLDVVKKWPDNSVDLFLTSSPFERKVQYLDPEHDLAELEIGHEETPASFIDVLLDNTEEWGRTLTEGGSIVVELGDSYAGSGGAGGDYSEDGKKSNKFKYEGTAAPARRNPGQWPLAKSLCGIPEAYRLSLMYGRNILNGRLLSRQWIVRNVNRLCSINPPRGRQGDKFTPATTECVVATLASDRFWEEDHANVSLYTKDKSANSRAKDWWVVKQQGDKGHPAVWPENVAQGFITALCPRSGVVVDPFAGSGRTITVAGDWGRHGIGIDLNPAYLEVATEGAGSMYMETMSPEQVGEWLQTNKLKFNQP